MDAGVCGRPSRLAEGGEQLRMTFFLLTGKVT
jgi:hypothetical protein